MVHSELILILDYGAQYSQLIARRVRELGVYSELVPFNMPVETLRARKPKGIILSGSPYSTYEPGAPISSPEVFALGIPVLGICYGLQLTAYQLGGEVDGEDPVKSVRQDALIRFLERRRGGCRRRRRPCSRG